MSDKQLDASVLLDAQQAVLDIGVKGKSKLPLVNDPKTAMLLELSVAKAVKAAADAREKKAREVVLAEFRSSIPSTPKQEYVAYDDNHVTLTVAVHTGAMKLDKGKLSLLLVDKHGLSIEQVEALYAAASKQDKGAVHLKAILRGAAE